MGNMSKKSFKAEKLTLILIDKAFLYDMLKN